MEPLKHIEEWRTPTHALLTRLQQSSVPYQLCLRDEGWIFYHFILPFLSIALKHEERLFKGAQYPDYKLVTTFLNVIKILSHSPHFHNF